MSRIICSHYFYLLDNNGNSSFIYSNIYEPDVYTVSIELFDPVIKPADFKSWAEYYWNYQFILAEKYLIPYLSSHFRSLEGINLLDVGCGEGGTTAAFAKAGAICYGTDIDEGRLKRSSEIHGNEDIHFELLDIYDIPASDLIAGKKFDLIVLRDVIEHLLNTEQALKNLKNLLSENGMIFLTFPPYYSVFGGHQQIMRSLPFIHLLPASIFFRLLSLFSDKKENIGKIKHIREVSLTISRLFRTLKKLGLQRIDSKYYLLRPSFKIRYGIPVLSSNIIGRIPFLREIKISGCYLLVAPRKPGDE